MCDFPPLAYTYQELPSPVGNNLEAMASNCRYVHRLATSCLDVRSSTANTQLRAYTCLDVTSSAANSLKIKISECRLPKAANSWKFGILRVVSHLPKLG